MAIEISPTPKIPMSLRVAAERRKLVVFVGAGVSRLAGAPNWNQFADAILNRLVELGKLTYAEIEQIRDFGPRLKLSIASGLLDQETHIDYEKILHNDPKLSNTDGRAIYRSIGKLSKTFITTNYDRWLDQEFSDIASIETESASALAPELRRNLYCTKADFRPDIIGQEGSVFHIHGSVRDTSSMVVTTRHYLEHYKSQHAKEGGEQNQLLIFLQHLFAKWNVLFVGYSLEEIEILEYVIQKATSSPTNEEPKHYILMPFFSHQRAMVQHLERYYREQCFVGLLPYLRDQNDYRQLIDVLGHFADQLQPIGTAETRDIEALEALLEDARS